MGSMNTLAQNLHQYLYNRHVSKKLCIELENVINEFNYYSAKYNYPEMDRLKATKETIQLRQMVIWEQQVELFFKIKKQQEDEGPKITEPWNDISKLIA